MENIKYTRFINNLNYLKSPTILDADTEIEVSKEEYEKTNSCKLTKAGRGNTDLKTFELVNTPVIDALRFARTVQCFPLINRSQLGYDTLTESQQQELKEGYQAGLDVTETGDVPIKPKGLK